MPKLTVTIKHRHEMPKTLEVDASQQKFIEDGQDILGYDIQDMKDGSGYPVDFQLSYRKWTRHLTNLVTRISGLSPHDMADFDFRCSYETGQSPYETAIQLLQENNFPFPDNFDPDMDEVNGLLFLATFTQAANTAVTRLEQAVQQAEQATPKDSV